MGTTPSTTTTPTTTTTTTSTTTTTTNISPVKFTLLEGNNVCKNRDFDIIKNLSTRLETVEACKSRCVQAIECVAITFWSKVRWCTVYTRFCDDPQEHAQFRAVYLVNR